MEHEVVRHPKGIPDHLGSFTTVYIRCPGDPSYLTKDISEPVPSSSQEQIVYVTC